MSLHRETRGANSSTRLPAPGSSVRRASYPERRHALERREQVITQFEALWDVLAVARYLSVSRSMVYKLEQAGELPCVRIGACVRFEPAVVRAFAMGGHSRSPDGGLRRVAPHR